MIFDKLKRIWTFYREGSRSLRLGGEKVRNNRFLLVQNGGLGDVCQFLPFAGQLGRSGCTLDVASPARFRPLYDRVVKMERFLALPSHRDRYHEFPRMLGSGRYEAAFAVSMNREAAFAAAVSGSADRYGMVENRKYYRGSRLFFSNILHVGEHMHVTERYRDLFRLHFPDFETDAGAVPPAPGVPGETIVVHPGGKWKPRRWPSVKYLDLAGELGREGRQVSVLLHHSEQDLVRFFDDRELPAGVSLRLIDSMEELMGAVESCSYFIGNDSGPAHLANLFGKPLTVVWGPGDLERIRPLGPNVQIVSKEIPCRPCRQYLHPERCENGTNDCLLTISVDDLLQAVTRHRNEQPWYSSVR